MPTADARTSPPSSRLRLAPESRVEIGRWAVEAYPFEACGVLVGGVSTSKTAVIRVFVARNLESVAAGSRYRLDPRDHLAAWRWARERDLEIVGYWHSHPDHPPVPSSRDRRLAWEGTSYLIVTVTPSGAGELRCWRLRQGSFVEEALSA